jgi:glutamate dehydrogenase/leucine dehydrogenase
MLLRLCRWSEKYVNEQLETLMSVAFDDLWAMSQKEAIPLRTASFALALQRVVRATVNRGFS